MHKFPTSCKPHLSILTSVVIQADRAALSRQASTQLLNGVAKRHTSWTCGTRNPCPIRILSGASV